MQAPRRRPRIRFLTASLVTAALCGVFGGMPPPAAAKDLTSRLGVGFANPFSEDLPSLSVRYYPGPLFGLAAALGIDTKEQESGFGIMVKAFRVVFTEDNLNFYMGSGIGLVSRERAGVNQSGFDVNGIIGAEFFLPGLDSLGFSFEAGIGVSSLTSAVRFRTIGDSPLRAGIVFYF